MAKYNPFLNPNFMMVPTRRKNRRTSRSNEDPMMRSMREAREAGPITFRLAPRSGQTSNNSTVAEGVNAPVAVATEARREPLLAANDQNHQQQVGPSEVVVAVDNVEGSVAVRFFSVSIGAHKAICPKTKAFTCRG